MRNTFLNCLIKQSRVDKDIVLIVGDLGFNVVVPFAEEFPDRFFNSGVAEQNMMGLAAGLASEGMHPYVYSIANFPTFRCAEQIRNDVAYHNLSVTVVAVGGGLSYGNMGYSHHAVQDYALLRTMPNVIICSPGDPVELTEIMKFLNLNKGPSYLRLGRGGEPNIHKKINSLSPGEWQEIVKPKGDKVFLTTGAALSYGLDLIDKKDNFKSYGLYSLPIWGMKEKRIQSKFINKFKEIHVLEDHLIDGGFGSWILESENQFNPDSETKIILHGLDSKVSGMVGTQDFLNKEGWDLF
jgi:transketolase